MAKPKKTGRKPSVKVEDMAAKENPKGGAFLKIEGTTASPTRANQTVKLGKTNKVQF